MVARFTAVPGTLGTEWARCYHAITDVLLRSRYVSEYLNVASSPIHRRTPAFSSQMMGSVRHPPHEKAGVEVRCSWTPPSAS